MAIRPYISLFSGAGGLDLSLRIAIPESRCVCYCEREIGAARILAARMEDGSLESAPIWSDVRTFPSELFRGRVAGIVGGFPCTDLSVAGKRAGITGEHSGLWFEYERIIREVRPEWVFIENVPAVIAFPAGGIVLGGLAALGFDAEWLSLRASDVGLPHRRERVFILAYRAGRGCRKLRESSGRDGLTGGGGSARMADPEHAGPSRTRTAGRLRTEATDAGGSGELNVEYAERRQREQFARGRQRSGLTSRGGHQVNLQDQVTVWKTPHGMANVDRFGKRGGAGGGEFTKQANHWSLGMTELEQLRSDIENVTPVGRFTCGGCGGKFPAYFVAVRIESIAEGMLSGGGCPFCDHGGSDIITYDTLHGGTADPALSGVLEPPDEQ